MSDIGRNSLCPCGSGKKYKRCCLDKKESSNQNYNWMLRPQVFNERFVIGHPSLPKIYNDNNAATAYSLPLISMEEFLKNAVSKKTQKFLDQSLVSLNSKSKLNCYFSRSGDDIYFNIQNKFCESQLSIHADGAISFSSHSREFSYEPFLYLFYCLFHSEQCPWSFSEITPKWKMLRKIAKSLFTFRDEENPLCLKGIVINTNLCTEESLNEVGEKLNRIVSREKSAREDNDGQYKEVGDTLNGSSDNHEELFYYIKHGVTHRQYWWRNTNSNPDLSFWNHVQYIFSDNIICNLHELINHPYAVFLPKDLIPEKMTAKNKWGHLQFWKEKGTDHLHEYSKNASISKLFIQSFFQSNQFKSKELSLYLSSGENVLVHIDRCHLLEGRNNYRWEITDNQITGAFSPENKNEKNEDTLFQIEETSLVSTPAGVHWELNSFVAQKEIFKRIARQNDLTISTNTSNEIRATLTSDSSSFLIKSEFDKEMSDKFDLYLNLDHLEKIPNEDIRLNIFLGPTLNDLSEMGFNFEIRIPKTNSLYTLHKMPQLLYRILGGLVEGLGQFYYEYDNKDMATQQQGEKRKNDLKLLRHSGIFKLLSAEIIRYHQTPNEQKEKIKEFEKSLVKKAAMTLLPANEALDQVILENMISTRVKGLIKDFFNDLYLDNNLEAYLFSNGGKTYKINLKHHILIFLEVMINWMDQAYGDSTFTKTSIKEMQYTLNNYPANDQFITEQELIPQIFSCFKSSELTKAILTQLNCNLYDLNVGGKKIQSLSEELFTSSLFIGEEEGKINWFDLHPKVFFNGKEINFDQLQEMKVKEIIFFDGIPYSINFSKMPKLKFLDRFWSKLNNAKSLKKNKLGEKSNIYRQEKSLLLEVLSLRNSGIQISSVPEWEKICNDFDHLMNHQSDDLLRSDFLVPLKDYQKEGTQWIYNLYKIGLGGVLADDMGLGKTIQMIGFLDLMRLENKLDFHLIVVPTSLIYNWLSEIKKFAPLLEFVIFESKNKMEYDLQWRQTPPKIVIITYGLMAENSLFLNQFSWQSAIYDEAQNLKNITSLRSTAARSLKVLSNFCLTGTPMENHYGEFYSLIDLCVPGALGEYQDFMRTFSLEKISKKSELNSEVLFLRKKIDPLVLRRMKSDILEQLPEKSESSLLIPFEKEQREIYRNVAISWNDKIKSVIDNESKANTQLQMLTALLRLRQICSNPAMIENVSYKQIPPKFEILFEAVEEIYEKGESVLIFTNFVNTLQEIEKYFKAKGLRTYSIHGAITAKKRQSELKDFQESPSASVLIMTLKTGGVGLNLTKASYVFHVEPWWNPASENQATDRAHRMGQKKSVQVYRYLMKDSVEERIQELKNVKGKAFDALFKETISDESEEELKSHKSYSGQLSYSDFQDLLLPFRG